MEYISNCPPFDISNGIYLMIQFINTVQQEFVQTKKNILPKKTSGGEGWRKKLRANTNLFLEQILLRECHF